VIVSGDTLGLVKCFEVDGDRVVWSVTLVSRDAVNKTAVTSLASLTRRQQVACGMFGLVHIIDTTRGATLQTLYVYLHTHTRTHTRVCIFTLSHTHTHRDFERGGAGDPEWVNVVSAPPCPTGVRGGGGKHWLVAGGEMNSLTLWEGGGGGGGGRLEGFCGGICCVDASIDLGDITGCDIRAGGEGGEGGTTKLVVATAGRDGWVRVWEVVEGGKGEKGKGLQGLQCSWAFDTGTGEHKF
jgi:hypothetical protein